MWCAGEMAKWYFRLPCIRGKNYDEKAINENKKQH